MNKNLTRRSFLKITGLAGGTFLLSGCRFVNSLKGIPETSLPQNNDSWTYSDGRLVLDLSKLPELESLGGAVRIEGSILPDPLLVVYGEDGRYYAFKNACTHSGRMIDPVAGTMTLQCCSMSKATYDYQGNVVSGPAEQPLPSFPLEVKGTMLIIST